MNNEKIDTLRTVDEYLNNLKVGIKNIVEFIQEGKEQEGINMIGQVADGIEWVTRAISLTKDVQKSEIKMEQINEHLEAIIEALENEDYILIGDLFNYEIIPILDKIHGEVRMCIAN